MKINLPITDEEYVLLDSDSVVSKTDLNGIITFVNADFIRISGYTESELVGAAHNIIRHPDMPPEVFTDMWRSLQAGRPWVGVVKNRCKNGDFYWVLARMTPYYENDQRVGYLSVRTKPDSAQSAEAAETYRKLLAGEVGNLKIHDGKIVKDSLWVKLNFVKHLSIKCRLSLFSFSMLLLLLIVGGSGLFNMYKAKNELRTVYDHHMVPMAQIASIQKLLLDSRLFLTSSMFLANPEITAKKILKAEQSISEIATLWEAYNLTTLTSEEKKLADTFSENLKNFTEDGLKPTISALRTNDMVLANSLIVEKVNLLYESLDESIQNLIKIEQATTQQEYLLGQSRYDFAFNFFSGLIMSGILLVLWQRLYLARNIIRPLNNIIGFFGQIAQGNFKSVIKIERQDEIGKVLEGLKAMHIWLGFDVAQIKRFSEENLRIKIALDSICTGVMVADTDRNIVYANQAVSILLGQSDADLRKIEPNFSVDTLLGGSIDRFHQDPEHQAQLLSVLTATYKARITLGKRSMILTINPMFNQQGQRLGTVAEWRDRSAEVTVEKEVDSFVVAAIAGNFSKRFDLQDKEGFYRNLGEKLNQLLHVSEHSIDEVVRILIAVSEGDLTQTISNDYQDTLGQLITNVNRTVETLTYIICQIKNATANIHAEAKKIACDHQDVAMRTQTQATGLERAAISVQNMANSVQKNTINARLGNQLSTEATHLAGDGLNVIDQVVTTMTNIKEASGKMVDIISVIDGIAFQTNILALNAAVEAARAGKEGRGFAVVATEVRSLAQRSALAAADIKNLIHDSVEKVENGTHLVAQAGLTMEKMVESIRSVAAIMNQISMASMDQSFGIEQINLIMTHMEEVTQQNARMVADGAAVAKILEEQAKNLTGMIAEFKVNEKSDSLWTVSAEIPQKAVLATTVEVAKPKSQPPPVSEEWEEF